jgi:hypothetical protein
VAYWGRSNAPLCLAVEYVSPDNGTRAALLRRGGLGFHLGACRFGGLGLFTERDIDLKASGGLAHTAGEAASRQCIAARFGCVRDKGEARRISRGAPANIQNRRKSSLASLIVTLIEL